MENTNQNANNEKGAASGLRLSNKWQELRERMQHKRRFVVMDTDTFKETFSAELTGANIFTYAGLTFIVLLILRGVISVQHHSLGVSLPVSRIILFSAFIRS